MTIPEVKFPFARELQEQHDALRVAARWLQAELARARPGAGPSDPRESLRVFREQLIQHFRFEELNWIEGGVNSHDPEIQSWIQELIGQHRAFEERLGAILSPLEESGNDQGISAPLLTELGAFFGALRRHDAEENALLRWISRGPVELEPGLPLPPLRRIRPPVP